MISKQVFRCVILVAILLVVCYLFIKGTSNTILYTHISTNHYANFQEAQHIEDVIGYNSDDLDSDGENQPKSEAVVYGGIKHYEYYTRITNLTVPDLVGLNIDDPSLPRKPVDNREDLKSGSLTHTYRLTGNNTDLYLCISNY